MDKWRVEPGTDAVAVDVETTGLGTDDRIVAVAAVPIRDARPGTVFERLVNPGRDALERMGEEAVKVHGLTPATLAKAPPFEALWPELAFVLEEHPIVAHNAPFDQQMVAGELTRIDASHESAADPERWICTLALSRRAFGRESRHGLDALAKRCGVKGRGTADVHRAADDALLVARIWCALTAATQSAPDLFAEAPPTAPEALAAVHAIALNAADDAAYRAWCERHDLAPADRPPVEAVG